MLLGERHGATAPVCMDLFERAEDVEACASRMHADSPPASRVYVTVEAHPTASCGRPLAAPSRLDIISDRNAPLAAGTWHALRKLVSYYTRLLGAR
jgi:hypothetical protein